MSVTEKLSQNPRLSDPRMWTFLVGVFCSLIVMVASFRWLLVNDLPDGYQNEFIHLYTLGEIFFRLRDDGLAEAWPFLWDEYYPPLLHGPAVLGMALFGRSRTVAVLAQALWLVPLLFAAGALASRAAARPGDPGSTVAAPAIWVMLLLSGAPAVFGNVRRYEPNIALAACVALALWWLARGGLRTRRDAVVFGLICAGGLLVDRLVFAVYLAGPVAWLLWRERRWRQWLISGAVVVLFAGYYYARFLSLHLEEITSQLGGEITSGGASSGAVTGLVSWFYYPLSWIDGLGLVPALLVLCGLVLWVVSARARVDEGVRGVLESALVVGFAVFTLLGKKQPYYAIPLLAPALVCAATGWASVLTRDRVRRLLAAALALLSLNQLIFLSTGGAVLPLPGRWGVLGGASPLPDGFLGHEYVMAGPPFAQELRLARAQALCPDTPVTLLFSEGQAAFEGQVMPTLRLLADTRRVTGLLMEPEAWMESAPDARCFVYVSREPAREWPTPDSLRAVLVQWGYAPASPELLRVLGSVRQRATLVGDWKSAPDEGVYIYALGGGDGPAPD